MSDVVDRITARLDAMEAAATAATPGPWEPYCNEGYPAGLTGGNNVLFDADDGFGTHADAAHIALNDPAATLAIVAGLRAIVALHEERHGYDCGECGVLDGPCRTLLAIAAMWPDTDPRTAP